MANTTMMGARRMFSARRFIGKDVYDASGSHVGECEDLIIEVESGCTKWAIVTSGQVLGMGGRDYVGADPDPVDRVGIGRLCSRSRRTVSATPDLRPGQPCRRGTTSSGRGASTRTTAWSRAGRGRWVRARRTSSRGIRRATSSRPAQTYQQPGSAQQQPYQQPTSNRTYQQPAGGQSYQQPTSGQGYGGTQGQQGQRPYQQPIGRQQGSAYAGRSSEQSAGQMAGAGRRRRRRRRRPHR